MKEKKVKSKKEKIAFDIKTLGVLLIIVGIVLIIICINLNSSPSSAWSYNVKKNHADNQGIYIVSSIVCIVLGIFTIYGGSMYQHSDDNLMKMANEMKNNDVSEKIKKLNEMHEQGLINDTEFENKKKELLAKM